MFVWQNTEIKLIAAVYTVSGEFLRWENVGGGNLQVRCKMNDNKIAHQNLACKYHNCINCYYFTAC